MWGRVEEDPPEIEPDMQNMTTNVIQETYNVLRNTLGRDFDTLASVTVIVMLWQVLRSVQRRIEDVIFVQMSVGDELDDGGGSNRADDNGNDDEYRGRRGRRTRGMGGSSRAEESKADKEMAECVRTYASSRVLESRSVIAVLFPLPKLKITADIDSSTTLSDEPGCESKELNQKSEGVPLKTATIKPDLGATSVIIVDHASLLRLPFVWIAEGASDEGIVDKLQRSMPSLLASGFRALFERLGLLQLQRAAHDGMGRGPGDHGRGGASGGVAAKLGSVDAKAAEGSLILSTFAWNEDLLARVIDDARAFSQRRRTRRCEVRKLGFRDEDSRLGGDGESIYITHVRSGNGDHRALLWDIFEAPPRKLSSVFLPSDVEADLCRGIDEFLRRRNWYVRRGFRYQRAQPAPLTLWRGHVPPVHVSPTPHHVAEVYLLHGPPGNGKSSVMQALAAHYTMPLYIMQLSGGQVDANACRAALRITAKAPCIVAVEDAESCFVAKKKKKKKKGEEEEEESTHKPVTAKEFVELLTDDSEASPEGRILILTTNTVDMLDPALRSFLTDDGKFVEFPSASESVMRRVWLNFFQGSSSAEGLFDRFLVSLGAARAADPRAAALQVGVSAFQGYLMQFRDAPESAASAASVANFVAKRLSEKLKREERGQEEQEESVLDSIARKPPSCQPSRQPSRRPSRPLDDDDNDDDDDDDDSVNLLPLSPRRLPSRQPTRDMPAAPAATRSRSASSRSLLSRHRTSEDGGGLLLPKRSRTLGAGADPQAAPPQPLPRGASGRLARAPSYRASPPVDTEFTAGEPVQPVRGASEARRVV